MTAPQPRPADEAGGPTALDWVGVVLVTLSAMLAGVLESLLVPVYAGTVVVPIAVVFALWSNVALPRLARRFVPTTLACALPFLGWLLVVIGFGVVARPEGDVILPGGGGAVHFVTYGVLLGGALAGTISVVTAIPPGPRGPAQGRTRVSR